MATIVGSGDYKYRIIEDWAKLPDGWSFKEVAAVGVDANDNVYAFGRGDHPMMVFDRDGNFLRSWGEGQYPRAHGVHMVPDDSIYLTDDGDQCLLERYGVHLHASFEPTRRKIILPYVVVKGLPTQIAGHLHRWPR